MAELVEVEENSSANMQAIRSPPIITINKSAAYALYELTYIRVRKNIEVYPDLTTNYSAIL